jgi:magnesium-transporting ATPase (P-type)
MDYLLGLVLCHSVTIDISTQKYSAASPDEIAFVEFTKKAGFTFMGKDSEDNIMIEDSTLKGEC